MMKAPMGICLIAVACGCTGIPAAPDGSTGLGPDAAIEEAGPTLQFHLIDFAEDSAEVFLGYYRRADQVGPRSVEILLDTSSNLIFLSSRTEQAAEKADKRLVVQEQEDGLRVILFSTTSLERIDTGFLVSLSFGRDDPEPATLALRNPGSLFAPAEANHGFVPPDPLTIGGF